jgi:hypothetical protein
MTHDLVGPRRLPHLGTPGLRRELPRVHKTPRLRQDPACSLARPAEPKSKPCMQDLRRVPVFPRARRSQSQRPGNWGPHRLLPCVHAPGPRRGQSQKAGTPVRTGYSRVFTRPTPVAVKVKKPELLSAPGTSVCSRARPPSRSKSKSRNSRPHRLLPRESKTPELPTVAGSSRVFTRTRRLGPMTPWGATEGAETHARPRPPPRALRQLRRVSVGACIASKQSAQRVSQRTNAPHQ